MTLAWASALLLCAGLVAPALAQDGLAAEDVPLGADTGEAPGSAEDVPLSPDEAGGEPPFRFQPGPMKGTLGRIASVDVPEGFVFLDQDDTANLLQLMGNPVSGDEVGTLASASDDEQWFLFFEFDDIGYVSDEEKDSLDADAILKSIREGTEAANEWRREQGAGTLDIVGWEVEPRYDEATNNLVWAIRAQGTDADGTSHPVLNYNIRLLGRRGVMQAVLVIDPAELPATLPVVNQLLEGYSYNEGERYAEYRQGDRVAEYGLAALVAGGAAAVALKSGLLQKFGKVIILAVAAVGATLKKVFGSILGKAPKEKSDV